MTQSNTEPTHVTISIAFAALAAAVFFNSKTTLVLVMSGSAFVLAALGASSLYWSMISLHLPEVKDHYHDRGWRGLRGPTRLIARWIQLWSRQLRGAREAERRELGYLNILAAMTLVNLAITIRGLEYLVARIV